MLSEDSSGHVNGIRIQGMRSKVTKNNRTEDKSIDQTFLDKLQHGLMATSDELYQLILCPDLDYVQTLLKNRQLNEEHLLTLLKRRDLTESLILAIHKRHKNSTHKLLVALCKNRATPSSLLRRLLPHLYLFELVDLLTLPGFPPDHKVAAERETLRRLPTVPLGSKITLARRSSSQIVAALMKDGNPQLVEICLNNKHLTESAIYQFLQGSTASAETISMIARHTRWNQRKNLQLSILKNSKTPDIWFTLWLPKLPLHTLKTLLFQHKNSLGKKRLISSAIDSKLK